jgi:hypothetical protein
MAARTPLSVSLIGTWELVSRQDFDAAGNLKIDPALGPDPIGILVYDKAERFAAQFMKRDRSSPAPIQTGVAPALNNSQARGGYDAYFGTYTVDDNRGLVTQTLLGALSPENVGLTLTREMVVEGDTLKLDLETTGVDGEKVVRKLRWRRLA